MKLFAQILDSFSIQALTALAVTSLAALGWSAQAAEQSKPVPAPLEETAPGQEPVTQYRDDAAYAELLEGLEIGMRSLKELGREDALRVLEHVASDVRAERESAIEEVRGRLR